MTNKKMPNPASTKPIIYVHAKGHGQIDQHSVQKLLEPGLPVCTRLKLKGLTQTVNGYDQPALLVAELADLFPGRPIILMRAGLQPTRQLIDKLTVLMEQMDQPIALTLLSNADVSVNPFAGLQASPGGLQCDPGELVKLLAPGRLHSLGVFVDHFVLLSADLVSRLTTENSDGGLMQRLLAAGATLM
ncbi:MAG: hypothetical protein WBN06_04240, partial [Lysobacterales bacterium]